MSDYPILETTLRDTRGKGVKRLRNAGIVPGVLYGPTIDAIPVQMPWTELRPLLLAAGGSSIIELKIDDESYNALIRDVQRSPIRGDVLHIDFYRVRMDVAIRTEVPIITVGHSLELIEAGGTYLQEMNSIEVECLPGDLPPHIEIDISGLDEIGQTILVNDLPELPGVTYLANAEETVITTTYAVRALTEEEEAEELEGEIEEGEEPELIRPDREEDEEEED